MVDVDAAVGAAGVADEPGFGDDAAGQRMRHPVPADLAAQARRQRQVRIQIAVIEAGGEQKVARRDVAAFEFDHARAVAQRRDRRRQAPWLLGVARADRDHDAAAVRPLETQRNILERPAFASAGVIDGETAVLQAELAQIVAVEPGLADTVDPGQERGEGFGGVAAPRRTRWPWRRRTTAATTALPKLRPAVQPAPPESRPRARLRSDAC